VALSVDDVLWVTLCRFDSEVLVREEHPLYEAEYIAISHVWGNAEWLLVPGIANEVLSSRQKAIFLANQLPKLVGTQYFWMDILCIDQHDENNRIAIIQHIPTIFRRAIRTMVVKDGGALQPCCAIAIAEILDESWRERLALHLTSIHYNIEFLAEGVCERLWPLQEIVLSNNVQFVTCEDLPVHNVDLREVR